MAAGIDGSVSTSEGQSILDTWERESIFGIVDDDESSLGGMEEADRVLSLISGVQGGDDSPKSMTTNSRQKDEVQRRRDRAKSLMRRLSGNGVQNEFTSRECSNLCWALTKLRLAPPAAAFPIARLVQDDHPSPNSDVGNDVDGRVFHSVDEMSLDILHSCLKVRGLLLEEAKKRKMGEWNDSSGGAVWIPELSRLVGKLLDLLALQIIREYKSRQHPSEDINDDNQRNSPFNSQEMASLLWAFAKAQRAHDTLFSVVAAEFIRQTMLMKEGYMRPKPQEFSNTIWAFATAGIRGKVLVSLVKLMADKLDEGKGQFFGSSFKPQELANSAWALATLHSKRVQTDVIEDAGVVRILRWVAKDIQRHVHLYKPQELSNTVWAFATVGFGYDESCGTNIHNDYIHVVSDSPIEDKALVFETLDIIAENANSRLEKFKAQELNNLMWGFARIGQRTESADELFQGIANQLAQRVHQFKPQDVGTTLWSLATVEKFDHLAFQAGASRLNFQHIRLFKPQEMSNTVWALATAGISPKFIHAFDTTLVPSTQRPSIDVIKKDPFTECFAAVAGETMRRPQDFKDQELKDVLWSFSKIGVRHPSLFKSVAEHIVGKNGRGFSAFSSQGLGNTLWSFAKQAQLSLDVIDSLGLNSVKVSTTGRLAVYETSCLDVGEDLIKLLFVRAAETGISMGLDRYKTQDISNTCWSYSTLGLLHSGLFKEVELEVMSRLTRRAATSGQEIANILWSFATLNAQPDPKLIEAFSSHICSVCSDKNGPNLSLIARTFKRQEIANIAWSCAVIGRYPEALMSLLYTGLFGLAEDPDKMKDVFGDNGLQKSSIMTMNYVQFAADVEAPQLNLSLPEGFPTGWVEEERDLSRAVTENVENDLTQTSSSMLTLTISKLQREVSETLSQIGFENILEHVIDTPSRREFIQHGSHKLPETTEEFLSIDIANIEGKIGVEVDGPGHFVRLIDTAQTSAALPHRESLFADRGENRVNGPTILKHRLLSHLGWNIIHIPYWEYQNLGGDKEKEINYCRDILDCHRALR